MIRLRAGGAQSRQRLSIAHEIGHTFFYELNDSPPVRIIARKSSGTISRKEEDICKTFARELLMPRQLVHEELNTLSHKSGLDLILHLAQTFAVSCEVATIRLLWDLLELESYVAIVKETSKLGKRNKPVRIQRHRGNAAKRLRKKAELLLKFVTLVIYEGPPYDILDEIACLYSDTVDLQWKLTESKNYSIVLALLSFNK